MIPCPSCRNQNDDDAAFCDQCAAPLRDPEKVLEQEVAEAAGERCPDCGGAVRELPGGRGECVSCGIALRAEDDGEPDAEPEAALSERLAAAIKAKLRAGTPVELAVDLSCRELLEGGGKPAEVVGPAECPVCGAARSPAGGRCPGCGISFKTGAAPSPCPRCGEECSGAECECGAILTLPRLVELVDPSVLFVCPKCRALFTGRQAACRDCGAPVASAERLKRYAEAVTRG